MNSLWTRTQDTGRPHIKYGQKLLQNHLTILGWCVPTPWRGITFFIFSEFCVTRLGWEPIGKFSLQLGNLCDLGWGERWSPQGTKVDWATAFALPPDQALHCVCVFCITWYVLFFNYCKIGEQEHFSVLNFRPSVQFYLYSVLTFNTVAKHLYRKNIDSGYKLNHFKLKCIPNEHARCENREKPWHETDSKIPCLSGWHQTVQL